MYIEMTDDASQNDAVGTHYDAAHHTAELLAERTNICLTPPCRLLSHRRIIQASRDGAAVTALRSLLVSFVCLFCLFVCKVGFEGASTSGSVFAYPAGIRR